MANPSTIVDVSRFAAVEPDPDFPTSAAMRAALADGIRMNNLMPGFVEGMLPTEDRLSRIPAGRYAAVDAIAHVIAFLVDGGLVRST